VAKYVEGFPRDYEVSTIELPDDESEAQAVLPVIAGYECERCEGRPFRSSAEKRWIMHGVKEHGLMWADAKENPRKVFMQSWFLAGRQRYWRVKKGAVEEPAAAEPGDAVYIAGSVEGMAEGSMAVGQQHEREGRRERKRRMTDIGVHTRGELDVRGRRSTSVQETTMGGEEAMANSGKRRASAVAGHAEKRVRFAGQVEIGGLDGLRQQLERWSKECVVCYLVGRDEGDSGRRHTIWECGQAVADEIRADSREMEGRMRAVAAGGGCTGCRAPRTMCERWQWGARWEESAGRCQYEGVLVSTMMAMATLGQADGRRQVGRWLRRDGVDPRGSEEEVSRWFGKQIWWEGVEAGQVVLVFMMLARMNGALRVLW
jgi:hypothetical protein